MNGGVQLQVFDLQGRLVEMLVNEPQESGFYSVTFDGSALSSGVYFYRLRAGNFCQSKKMIILK